MDDPRSWTPPEEDDLPTERPLFVKVVALIVVVGLVVYIADLFFAMILG